MTTSIDCAPLSATDAASLPYLALGEAMMEHGNLAFRVALSLVGNASDAQDVVQAACLQILQHRDRYEEARGSFLNYYLGVVVNMARMFLRENTRRKRREQMASEQVSEATHDTVFEQHEHHDQITQVRRELDALPVHYRCAVQMVYINGLSHRESAAILGISEGSLRSKIKRGLDRIRDRLGATVPLSVLPAIRAILP